MTLPLRPVAVQTELWPTALKVTGLPDAPPVALHVLVTPPTAIEFGVQTNEVMVCGAGFTVIRTDPDAVL